jgi:hypothetical protein
MITEWDAPKIIRWFGNTSIQGPITLKRGAAEKAADALFVLILLRVP